MAVNTFLGTTDNNWGTASNWSLLAIPTSNDGHVATFSALSPNCTVASSNRQCNNIDFTGYVNTITMTTSIIVSGNITLSATMLISGSASLIISASGTITSNGKVWPNNFSCSTGSSTATLVGDFSIAGSLVVASPLILNRTTTETLTVNGINCSGDSLSGTAVIIVTGGTVSTTGNNVISSSLTLQGNITFSGTVNYSAGTMTYVSGTVTTSGSTLRLSTCTLNTNGVLWNILRAGNTSVITLTSNLSCAQINLSGINEDLTFNKTTSETVTISNGLSLTSTTNGGIAGTADLYITGGTWVSTTIGTGDNAISSNLFINGNVTIGTLAHYRTGTLTYLSGTVVTTSSTLMLLGSCTLSTNGITWNNITLANTSSQTYTTNSLLSVTATLTIGTGASTIFAGSDGFNVHTLLCANTSVTTVSFKESVTYTITSLFNASSSRVGSNVLFTSSHATLKANILMPNNGSNSCNLLASFRRIDASGGRTINSFGGTITDCDNIISFTDRAPYAGSMAA